MKNIFTIEKNSELGNTKDVKNAKYFAFLAMLYTTIMLSTVVLIYKIIPVGPFLVSVSTFIIPFWYSLGDVIAEVYGYKKSRTLIWFAITCQGFFAFICAGMIVLPSSPTWQYQGAYDHVLGKLPRVFLASFVAILLGSFLNVYVLTKWKILLQGKRFWMRSIGSTAIGELIFTVVGFSITFIGSVPFSRVIQLMLVSYGVKLLVAPFIAPFCAFAASKLKKAEGMDVYDNNTNFNPFKLEL